MSDCLRSRVRSGYAGAALLACVFAGTGCDREGSSRPPTADEPPGLPERTAEPVQQAAAEVSKSEVAKFSATQAKLMELQSALQSKVQQGGDPNQVQQEYQRQAGRIVSDSGLSLERYEAIARQAAEDATLREEVQQLTADNRQK